MRLPAPNEVSRVCRVGVPALFRSVSSRAPMWVYLLSYSPHPPCLIPEQTPTGSNFTTSSASSSPMVAGAHPVDRVPGFSEQVWGVVWGVRVCLRVCSIDAF